MESTNSMSQEIGPVTLCHSMSLVRDLILSSQPAEIGTALNHRAEFSYLWSVAAAIKNPYLEIDSSCYQKNPKADLIDLIAVAIKKTL